MVLEQKKIPIRSSDSVVVERGQAILVQKRVIFIAIFQGTPQGNVKKLVSWRKTSTHQTLTISEHPWESPAVAQQSHFSITMHKIMENHQLRWVARLKIKTPDRLSCLVESPEYFVEELFFLKCCLRPPHRGFLVFWPKL